MKSAWDQVTLRVRSWIGPQPEGGDELRTRTGRRYQILEVKDRLLVCMVLPSDAEVQGRIFEWEWGKRTKRQ